MGILTDIIDSPPSPFSDYNLEDEIADLRQAAEIIRERALNTLYEIIFEDWKRRMAKRFSKPPTIP